MTSLTTISWTATANAKEAVDHALFAGYQSDGKKVYVGKVQDESGNFIPSKIIPEENKAYYEKNGAEKTADRMEYLFHNEGYEWLKSSNGVPVPDAVMLSDSYIGRAEIDGTTVVGKVDMQRKQLIASYYGKILNLSDYDVLVFKPQTNKTQFQQAVSVTKEFNSIYSDVRSDSSFVETRMESFERHRTTAYYQQKLLEMQHKMQTMEIELANYRNDRTNYEEKISFERRRYEQLSKQMHAIKLENSSYISERSSWEIKISSETSKISNLEMKLRDYINENSLLLKKVSTLEETLKTERYQMEKYMSEFKMELGSSSGSSSSRIKEFEEKIKFLQTRIFELEMTVENANVETESHKSQLTQYQSTIEHQKIQVESVLKKLQNSNSDNEFLIKKVELLNQSLQSYRFEIESMSIQLKNAKSIIAGLSAELARSNGQLAKFQAALSNSYILNGELMTKVSSFSSMSQYQTSFESKYDLLNVNLSSIEAKSKSYTYNTPSLLEAIGSETFTEYARSSSSSSSIFESNSKSEKGEIKATPYTTAEAEKA